MQLVLYLAKEDAGRSFVGRRIEAFGQTIADLGLIEIVQKDGEDYETAKNRTIEEAKQTKIRAT